MMQDEHYFNHDADIGIIARGASLEACFVDGAKCLFSLMTDLSFVQAIYTISFEFEEADVELAFVTWLNLLLAHAHANNLILYQFQIQHEGNLWQASASGEVWRDDIERGIDVKGATLTMLSVKQVDGEWTATCVLDV